MENKEFEAKESEINESETTDPFEIEESKDSEELDIYTEEGMENYVDDDGITPSEEGFMVGYIGG
ncbi:MAG: hypothetical protein AABX34_02085 [Nanoarchaeota archaeon]